MKMCVLFVILAIGSQHASGMEVEVYKGEEPVLLPCQFAAPIPEDYAIVWRRDDLSSPIVHSIVEGKHDLSSQNKRYTHRTSMRDDALQSGDLSLTLRNPTFTDSGNYTCLTRKDGEDKQRTEVQLKVTERPPPSVWHTVLPAVLVTVIVFGAVFGFILYRVKERQKIITVDQLTTVKVMEGEESVALPYKPTVPLPEGFKVEWIFVTEENKKLCVFENGQIKHDQQHEDYRERAESVQRWSHTKEKETDQLNESEVDLSLTLKKPVCADGGVYICFIYDKDGKPVKLKVVTLLVRERLGKTLRASVWNKNRTSSRRHCTVVLTTLEKNTAEAARHLNGKPI